MGNVPSSSTDNRFVAASRSLSFSLDILPQCDYSSFYLVWDRAFTQKELEDLKSLFVSLASQSQSDGRYVCSQVFKSYYRLFDPLGERIFDLATQKRANGKLTFEDLVIYKALYEKASNEEVEHFIFRLVDVYGDGIVTRSDIEAVLTAVRADIFRVSNTKHGFVIDGTMDVFTRAAVFFEHTGGLSGNVMSFQDFQTWCTHVPSIKRFLGNLLVQHDSGEVRCPVPRLLHSENVGSHMTILREEYAWHIGGVLSPNELAEWKLIYHSGFHGTSFTAFLHNVSDAQGETVLVIRDKAGYVYGGYASQPWKRHSDFYGDMKSFLFQLYPKASTFRPTGANTNFQWCGVNFTSPNIPNGIGFGGQVNHFGLFVSASFDDGHTFSCTTFGSPSLSKTNSLIPDVVECWSVFPKAVPVSQGGWRGTVLERCKEDRHILNMVGLANSSDPS